MILDNLQRLLGAACLGGFIFGVRLGFAFGRRLGCAGFEILGGIVHFILHLAGEEPHVRQERIKVGHLRGAHIIFSLLLKDSGSVSYTHLTLPTILRV